MGDESVRWTVVVDRETDEDLRSFLAEQGMEERDFSKFVKEAVRWRMFDRTLAEVRKGFEDMTPEDVADLVDEALAAVRANPEAYESDS